MNYLVTGGCGFIGVNLIRRLMNDGCEHRIRVLDNLTGGSREELAAVGSFQEFEAKELSNPPKSQLELVIGDVCDQSLTAVVGKGMDAIVHLAASTGVLPSIEDPRADCMANVIGTFNCLETARFNGVKRFVFASSGAPLGEQVSPIHEEMVPRPISPYGASKLCGEAYCSAHYESFGLETVILRFGNVYGPRSTHKGSVVAKFVRHILASEPIPIYGDGDQTRDFIYVDDLVEAIMLALDRPGVSGQAFQVGTQQEHSVGEVAEELNKLAQKYLGHTSPIIYEKRKRGEVRRNFSDISKARNILKFEPKWDLKRGLEETFLWFLERGK